MTKPNCPGLTVDIIAIDANIQRQIPKILLIERKNEPHGWALPGGFVDAGETLKNAAIRELMEETGIKVDNHIVQLGIYDDPARDPRHHNITVVYYCFFMGTPVAADDAKNVRLYDINDLPTMAFDHKKIIEDFNIFFYELKILQGSQDNNW